MKYLVSPNLYCLEEILIAIEQEALSLQTGWLVQSASKTYNYVEHIYLMV